jgi:hypothetical protein
LATYDGGLRWQALPIPQVNELACCSYQPFSATPAASTSGLCFGTRFSGWAVLARSATSGALEHTTDGGQSWSAVASFNPVPGQLACSGAGQAWVALTWPLEHGSASTLAFTADGGQTWSMLHYSAPAGFFSPKLQPSDGTPVANLGTQGLPPAVRWQEVYALASPGPRSAAYLWEDYSACMLGFGLVETSNGGASWWSAPPRASTTWYGCQTAGLPGLAAGLPPQVLALSFPSPAHGFVLGQAAGGPPASKSTSPSQVPVTLIGTANGGQTWAVYVAHLT